MSALPGGGGSSAPLPTPVLRTLVVCDLVDSTALVERLGDRESTDLFRQHDRIGRALVEHHGGREIDKTDGFLLLFERPVQALAFALDYQRALRDLAERVGKALRARVGIHVGDVIVYENAPDDVAHGAKPVEVEGLVKPITARLMTLALPGQILLSGTAYGLVQRAERELAEAAPGLAFAYHGRYGLKGVPEPMPVYAAGQTGHAPLQRPPSTDKAWRYVPWWRRPRVLLAEGAGVALVAAIVAFMTLGARPAIAFAERDWVVVGDLRNLTGQTVFDDALETALRISLEQSRFVNVLSDMQTADALRRMGKPADAPLDRAVAADIALRENARAVILPTVAETGGRLRISLEIVDPATQTTVVAESADGTGAESALPSIDRAVQGVRNRLGESLESISATSEPLERVATPSIEALRAYSLALRAIAERRVQEGLTLYAHALELDPEFSTVHGKLGGVYLLTGDARKAYEHIEQAAAHRERLPPRERLYVDGLLGFFASPREMNDRWLRLERMYPDHMAGQQNRAVVLWNYENDFQGAAQLFAAVATSRHPLRGFALQNEGTMRVGLGDVRGALERYAQSRELGATDLYFGAVDAHLVARDYAAADAALEAPSSAGLPMLALDRAFREAAAAADRGRFDAARNALERVGGADGPARSGAARERLELARLALAVRAGDADAAARLRSQLDAAVGSARTAAETLDYSGILHTLIAATLAARAGATDAAEVAIGAVEQTARANAFGDRLAWLAIARAETKLAADPAAALAELAPVDGPNVRYQVRYAALRAHAALGDADAAYAQADWLAANRGRAFAEWCEHFACLVSNTIASNDAMVAAAAFALEHGDSERARRYFEPVAQAWRDGDRSATAGADFRKVSAALSLDHEDP